MSEDLKTYWTLSIRPIRPQRLKLLLCRSCLLHIIFWRGQIIVLNTAPNPFLLNKICLNQNDHYFRHMNFLVDRKMHKVYCIKW